MTIMWYKSSALGDEFWGFLDCVSEHVYDCFCMCICDHVCTCVWVCLAMCLVFCESSHTHREGRERYFLGRWVVSSSILCSCVTRKCPVFQCGQTRHYLNIGNWTLAFLQLSEGHAPCYTCERVRAEHPGFASFLYAQLGWQSSVCSCLFSFLQPFRALEKSKYINKKECKQHIS